MSETVIKYDFENLDVNLYLALRALMSPCYSHVSAEKQKKVEQEARDALTAFELSRGPLPNWASDWNWNRSLVAGAQLMTKDGRRMGNAHIVNVTSGLDGSQIFECITDAGSSFALSEKEIDEAFWLGDFISTIQRILEDFDREGHYNIFRIFPTKKDQE